MLSECNLLKAYSKLFYNRTEKVMIATDFLNALGTMNKSLQGMGQSILPHFERLLWIRELFLLLFSTSTFVVYMRCSHI